MDQPTLIDHLQASLIEGGHGVDDSIEIVNAQRLHDNDHEPGSPYGFMIEHSHEENQP
jgi:hypothetical protein